MALTLDAARDAFRRQLSAGASDSALQTLLRVQAKVQPQLHEQLRAEAEAWLPGLKYAAYLHQWSRCAFQAAEGSAGAGDLLARARTVCEAAIASFESLNPSTVPAVTLVDAYETYEAIVRHAARSDLKQNHRAVDALYLHLAEQWITTGDVTANSADLEEIEEILAPTHSLIQTALKRLEDSLMHQLPAHLSSDTPIHGAVQAARLRLGSSMLLRVQTQTVISDRYSLHAQRCGMLEAAVRSLAAALWPPQGVPATLRRRPRDEKWRREHVEAGLEIAVRTRHIADSERSQVYGLVTRCLSNLADACSVTGRKRRAGWLLTYAREYGGTNSFAYDSARVEQDIQIWTAVGRLERHFSRRDSGVLTVPALSTPSISRGTSQIDTATSDGTTPWNDRDRNAVRLLRRLLRLLGNTRASAYWEYRLAANEERQSGPSPSDHELLPGDNEAEQRIDDMSSLPLPTDDPHETPRGDRVFVSLISARLRENTLGVIDNLVQLATGLGGLEVPKVFKSEATRLLLQRSLPLIESWRLPGRVYMPALSQAVEWQIDHLSVRRYVLELSIQFATNYAPGRLCWLWHELGDVIAQQHAPSGLENAELGRKIGSASEMAIGYYDYAAEAGQRVGLWRQAAEAHLDAARGMLNRLSSTGSELRHDQCDCRDRLWPKGNPEVRNNALRHIDKARRQLHMGLEGTAPGADRLDAVEAAMIEVSHTTKTYIAAHDTEDAFCTADLAIGVGLDALSLFETSTPATALTLAPIRGTFEARLELRSVHERRRIIEEILLAQELQSLADRRRTRPTTVEASGLRPAESPRGEDALADSDTDLRPALERRLAQLYEEQLAWRSDTPELGSPTATRATRRGTKRAEVIRPNHIRQVLERLPGQTPAIVQFITTRRGSFFIAVKRSDAGIEYRSWDLEQDPGQIARLASAIAEEIEPATGSRADTFAARLGERLFSTRSIGTTHQSAVTFEDWLNEVDVLGVIPHGTFARVPIHALREPATGAFVAARHKVFYAPSLKALRARVMTRPLARSRDVLLFSGLDDDERGGFQKEARMVASRLAAMKCSVGFPRPSTLRGQRDALLVHVAAHGYGGGGNPLDAWLELAAPSGAGQKERDPEVMTVANLLEGSGSFSLVFINACSAGNVVPRLGDLYGLGLPLLARARTVVAASCAIEPNSAHEVAEAFYRALGEHPNQSLLDIWHQAIDTTHALPKWAPYRFWGDPGPLLLVGASEGAARDELLPGSHHG